MTEPSFLSCPIDFRYARPAMKRIFSEEGRLERLLLVEAALARGHAALGTVPAKAAKEIADRASIEHVTLARVKDIERETQHDLMAVVKALTEKCKGDAGRYVHLGATSYDIVDTANALMFRDGLAILEEGLVDLMAELARLASGNRDTPCVGRTHGQHAVPMTFGLKMAVFLLETRRHLDRLRESKPRVLVGKMSGAVGTGAAFGAKALELQERVLADLGLGVEDGPTQIVQRDRYVELLSHLANLATSLEKFATEVRNLQRNEIAEVAEGFDEERQVGSSTMAQKRNPVRSEQVCGLARIVRSLVVPAYENAVQWHERDLANSSAERILLPHAFLLTDHILAESAGIFRGLVVDKARMLENLRATPTIMTESVMVRLVEKGVGRQDAHEACRRASLAWRPGDDFAALLLKDALVKKNLSAKEVKEALEPTRYVGMSAAIVDRALAATTPMLGRIRT